ncbi:10709_t:CDS:2 [Paraglomus brasilianum]|uniref:10709_t:CDS:1 n=1 Tax=Paraglomus brasilianum TaxID=144538 RepID=A0A9N8YY63_9GLOM|nr:10709_t:CDS:2 [Paraglomus brasilianum]
MSPSPESRTARERTQKMNQKTQASRINSCGDTDRLFYTFLTAMQVPYRRRHDRSLCFMILESTKRFAIVHFTVDHQGRFAAEYRKGKA